MDKAYPLYCTGQRGLPTLLYCSTRPLARHCSLSALSDLPHSLPTLAAHMAILASSMSQTSDIWSTNDQYESVIDDKDMMISTKLSPTSRLLRGDVDGWSSLTCSSALAPGAALAQCNQQTSRAMSDTQPDSWYSCQHTTPRHQSL